MRTQPGERVTLEDRFQAELVAEARATDHCKWVAAAEPSWLEHHVLIDPAVKDNVPADVLRPRHRTFKELLGPRAPHDPALPWLIVLVGLVLVLAFFMVPVLFPQGQLLILLGCLIGVFALGSLAFDDWRYRTIRADARTAIQKRTPHLDSIILLNDLSPESSELLEASRSMGVRDETAWAIATLLLEIDQDRAELDRYKKFLPANPKEKENPANPLYEVMDKIQDRINTRMRTIATHVTGDVPAAAKHEEDAR